MPFTLEAAGVLTATPMALGTHCLKLRIFINIVFYASK
ncbi:hypothetical protein FORC065_3292 [Yersinia enterocolitica]|nr:hypothetical protein FORC065_3292 [Yersinia enterocolitica]